MTRNEVTLTSVTAVLVLACAVLLGTMYVGSTLMSDVDGKYVKLIGYVFFIEPHFSTVDCSGDIGSHTPLVVFAGWMVTAALVAKVRRQNRRFRLACLVAFPALAICAFNGVFDTGDIMPSVEPAAVVAVIGVVLYEIANAGSWTRLSLAVITFGLCAAYGVNTGFGFWGTVVASGTMALVQLLWSGLEMNLFDSTCVLQGRKFQYR